jgi:hypothetical protein
MNTRSWNSVWLKEIYFDTRDDMKLRRKMFSTLLKSRVYFILVRCRVMFVAEIFRVSYSVSAFFKSVNN